MDNRVENRYDMIQRGLGGHRFPALARMYTQEYTTGRLLPCIIRDETDASRSLSTFFDIVNYFNHDFYRYLEPDLPLPEPDTQIYARPLVTFGVTSFPDIVITDGSVDMNEVGLGEIKPPWVVTFASMSNFMGRLPFANFGEEFVAAPDQTDEILRFGRTLTQIYSDLLTDRLSLGFLATTEGIVYCYVPAEERTRLNIFLQQIYCVEQAWMFEPGRFTAQVGLATLAWMAKTFFARKQSRRPKMAIWGTHDGNCS